MESAEQPAGDVSGTAEAEDTELKESEVTSGDRLDDRVSEGEGLPGDDGDGE